MNAVAFGEVAKALGSVKVGDKLSVKGFLSRKSRYSSFPILHITQFKHSS
jgi:primosomal replication protein N